MGSALDAQIYNASELKECVEDGSLGFRDPEPLPNDNLDVPYVFVRDDAFALRPDMMKPYSLRGMTRPERILNYLLSRARRVVENAFGILANRFQVLLGVWGDHQLILVIGKRVVLLVFSSLGSGRCLRCQH